eukprot:TRINITY_DN13352_c0_g1_i2.p1 TRINITY_DN13352_c0_g1~~TRINITY_DN13352_c0_g1_i2.p1  ORF type:complete len:207 (-),score=12.00 TRINITY_DN13352_c0_g1_i2:193-813(-)
MHELPQSAGWVRFVHSDSLRNRLRVDIFFVKLEMDVDVSHYLLGVRESGEGDRLDTPYTPLQYGKRLSSRVHKGTPSSCERAGFEDEVSPQPSTPSDRLQFPHLALTSMDAQYRSLLMCLSSWNVSVDRLTCCSFHEYVIAAKVVLAKLREAPCHRSFPGLGPSSTQCQECGILESELEARVCGFCDSRNGQSSHCEPRSSLPMQL